MIRITSIYRGRENQKGAGEPVSRIQWISLYCHSNGGRLGDAIFVTECPRLSTNSSVAGSYCLTSPTAGLLCALSIASIGDTITTTCILSMGSFFQDKHHPINLLKEKEKKKVRSHQTVNTNRLIILHLSTQKKIILYQI